MENFNKSNQVGFHTTRRNSEVKIVGEKYFHLLRLILFRIQVMNL